MVKVWVRVRLDMVMFSMRSMSPANHGAILGSVGSIIHNIHNNAG